MRHISSRSGFGAVVCRWRKSGRVLFAAALVVLSGTAAAAFQWLATMRRANTDIIVRLCKFNFFFPRSPLPVRE